MEMNFPPRESLEVEFKSDKRGLPDQTIYDEVVGLANTQGGFLYIGIEDDGLPTGAQKQHRDPVALAAKIANNTVPPVQVRIDIYDEGPLAETPVVRVSVPRSESIVATASGRTLHRRLAQDGEPRCIPLYPHEITTRLSDLGRLDFTAQPVVGATRDDFDPIERDRLRQIIRRRDTEGSTDTVLAELLDEDLEKALSLTTTFEGRDIPTLTGLLLLGKPDSLTRLVPTAQAVFQALRGTAVVVNQTLNGTILFAIDEMLRMLEPWNPSTELEGAVSRATVRAVPDFDRRAVREGLVNAFSHRDWSALGRVEMQVNDDGLSIASPGGFILGISERNILTARPRGRNPCLADALKRIGLAERTGRGVDRIFEGSVTLGRTLPDYSLSTPDEVVLSIARSPIDRSFVALLERAEQRAGRPLSLQSLLVLDCVRKNPGISEKAVAAHVDLSRNALPALLARLGEEGLLVKASKDGEAGYQLPPSTRAEVPSTGIQTAIESSKGVGDLPSAILGIIGRKHAASTADVANELSLTRDQAYYALKQLAQQGLVLREGRGRATVYTLPRRN